MTFAKRQIDLQFSDGNGTVTLEGLRCHAVIQKPGGINNSDNLELRVWGMPLELMNQFSSIGMNAALINTRVITVHAGTIGKVIANVFQGHILRSYIDFSSAPDVCFVVSAVTALIDRVLAVSPNSYPGAQNAETLITSLGASAGYAVNNNGAHAIVRNQYVSGSVIAQIETIARAAAIPMRIEGQNIFIWSNDGFRDIVNIDLGPSTGMIGYPSYWESGFIVKSEFNNMIQVGRQITLSSAIPKSNGTWPVQAASHELATLMPDGPWFTTAKLAAAPYVSRN